MEDPLQVATARWLMGVYSLNMGELESAREHLEHVIESYDPKQHAALVATSAQDLGVSSLKWASWTLWLLGYPDQTLERSQEALALAREPGHTYTLGFALFVAAFFHQMRREDRMAQKRNQRMMDLATREGFPLFLTGGDILQGWTLARAGHTDTGVTHIHQGGDLPGDGDDDAALSLAGSIGRGTR